MSGHRKTTDEEQRTVGWARPAGGEGTRPVETRIEFWSSTEVAAFQTALVQELRTAGLAAEERFVVSEPEYWSARTRWRRWRMRWRAYGWYVVCLFRHFARARPGVVGVVCSNTFYAPRVALAAARGRHPIIHWVFDLFPDALVVNGLLRADGVVERWLRTLMRQTFDQAAANVFLGEHLLRHAEQRFGPIPRTVVIPVGADGAPFRDMGRVLSAAPVPDRLTVLYCGNLGRMHEIETVIAALPTMHDAAVSVEFLGNGPVYARLNSRLRDQPHIRFGPNLPAEQWVAKMKSTPVALVLLKNYAAGLVMPSKSYSALVAGQALLGVCPRESDLAKLILRHDAGWVVEPGDVAGLASTLRHMIDHPEEVRQKRRNAWRAGHEHYDERAVGVQWRGLIESVVSGGGLMRSGRSAR